MHVTTNDRKQLEQIINEVGTNTDLVCTIARKRLKILTTDHYLMIGYLIGETSTARSLWGEINKSLTLCQRQN